MAQIKGYVILTDKNDNKYTYKNTIINLSMLLNTIFALTSQNKTPSSIQQSYISIMNTNYPVSLSISQITNGYQFTYTSIQSKPISINGMQLYPYSMSAFSLPLAQIIFPSPIANVQQIEWILQVTDETGLLYSVLPPQIVPNSGFSAIIYLNDGYINNVQQIFQYSRYIYGYLADGTTGNTISSVNAHYFVIGPNTGLPSAIKIGNMYALQLVPNSSYQYSTFYYLSNTSNFIMQFSYSAGSSPPTGGFAVTLFSPTPPIVFNTAGVSGMQNSNCLVGTGQNIVVEFNPYASQPFSVTQWNNGSYVSTLLSTSGGGTGVSMTAGHQYILVINYNSSNNSLSFNVEDTTTDTIIASNSVTLPFTPISPPFYIFVTARSGGNSNNWSLINIADWYPYSIILPANFKSPQPIVVTATYSSS